MVERELREDWGDGKFLFIGSSIDMFSDAIPSAWIGAVLKKCTEHKCRFLYQSKNPRRFMEFLDEAPPNVVFATTIESDQDHPEAYESGNINNGQPEISARVNGIMQVRQAGHPITITIEPIMAFDLSALLMIIGDLQPEWVSIGADSQGHNLPEPTKDETLALIRELKRNHKVMLKQNLNRIIGKGE